MNRTQAIELLVYVIGREANESCVGRDELAEALREGREALAALGATEAELAELRIAS